MEQKQKVDLVVRGMNCANCTSHVERALRHVEGVISVDVPSWQSSEAIVIANQGVTDESLAQAVKDAGYQARVKARRPMQDAIEPKQDDPTSETDENDFDLLVIGAGSAGFAAAIKGVDLGFRVGLIGDGDIGGTCVNVGCVPSKTLIRAAEAWHSAAHHPFQGVTTRQVELEWDVVRAQKDSLVAYMRQSKYMDVLAAYPQITYLEGRARFTKGGRVEVGDNLYSASRYLIVTGAKPRMIPFPGIEQVEPLNSTTLMDLDKLPESLIILGGRAVALELGQAMARLGVNILILQRSPRLVPEHEPEIGRKIKEYFEQEGIAVVTGVEIESLARDGNARIVHTRVSGQKKKFAADQIFFALGRDPNTTGLGLEEMNVELDRAGAIIVDQYQQTSNPAIFAAGDVTQNPEYVYVAAAGAVTAAQNALATSRKALDLSALPGVIFTDPQIATVGLTESQAKKAGHAVKTSTVDLEHVARAQAAHDVRGFIKLVADQDTNRLLGAHILAAEAGEVVQSATLAIKFGLTLHDLADTLFPYLTQVEGLKLATLAFEKDLAMLSCCAI